jgi:hypothetical protein
MVIMSLEGGSSPALSWVHREVPGSKAGPGGGGEGASRLVRWRVLVWAERGLARSVLWVGRATVLDLAADLLTGHVEYARGDKMTVSDAATAA